MLKGKYIGPRQFLFKQTALLQKLPNNEHMVMVQFDDLELPKHITHGWTMFPKHHFRILEKTYG